MADDKKNISDTLSQQRKAREEFLELKRMQSGETKPPPPPSADSITPATLNDKAKNFWFYYRWPVIVIIFVVIVLAICIKQCASRVNYDLCVTVYTSSPVGDKDDERIAAYFEKLCPDINKDGEIHVGVYNCSYAAGSNKQMMYASDTKLQAILTSETNAMLFITDDVTFERLQSLESVKTLFDKSTELGDDFNTFCEDNGDYYILPENLMLSRRVISNTVMKKDKTAAECYKAAGDILDALRGNDK